jgi:hypothetical protein
MNRSKITFGQLRRVLERLGYTAESVKLSSPNGGVSRHPTVFRHPKSAITVILRRMRDREILKPIDLLSVQNALANGGIVPKERFDSLFHEPIELWHAIIDAETRYARQHGRPPSVLKLPVPQAYDLAKLRRDEFGPLAERVMREGIKVFEEEGLPGLSTPVQLVQDANEFAFE